MISELLDNAKILCFKILYYEKVRIYHNHNFCMGKFVLCPINSVK